MSTLIYYTYNNIAIIACTITAILHSRSHVPMSKVSVLLPLLLDDSITEKLVTQHYNSLDALIQQNRIPLANFNDRYKDLLPQMIDSIAMLLDMNIVSLCGETARLIDNSFYIEIQQNNQSERLDTICKAINKLMPLVEKQDISRIYSKLNILL